MMRWTQMREILVSGLTVVQPILGVVDLADAGGATAPGEAARAIPNSQPGA
jgi:hypothetical protein